MKYFVKIVLLVFFYLPLWVNAQPGIAEFGEVSSTVSSWYFSFSDLVLVIGVISGLVGGLRVYANWQSGKHHIDAQVMGWFFSCLFLSIIGTALKALFGLH